MMMYFKLYYSRVSYNFTPIKHFGFYVLGKLIDFMNMLQHFAELQFQPLSKSSNKIYFLQN